MATLGTPPPSSEITPEPLYLRRCEFIKNSLLFTATTTGVGGSLLWLTKGGRATAKATRQTTDAATNSVQAAASAAPAVGTSPELQIAGRSPLSTDEPMTSERDVTPTTTSTSSAPTNRTRRRTPAPCGRGHGRSRSKERCARRK